MNIRSRTELSQLYQTSDILLLVCMQTHLHQVSEVVTGDHIYCHLITDYCV